MPETTPMILLLAAGHSSRMRGQDKLMQEVAGQPLLRVMAQRACKAGVPVRVVLGAAQSARRDALAGLDVEIVEALDGDGMAASIRAGVAGVTGPVMLVLADMPEITAYDLYLMVTLSGRAPKAILRAASNAGAPGHPARYRGCVQRRDRLGGAADQVVVAGRLEAHPLEVLAVGFGRAVAAHGGDAVAAEHLGAAAEQPVSET